MNSEKGVIVPVLKKHITFREITVVTLAIVFSVCAVGCCAGLIIHHHLGTDTTVVVNVTVQDVCVTQPCFLAAAGAVGIRDSAVEPCDDFFNYACGNWLKYEPKSSIQPDEQEKSIYQLVAERSEEDILKVLTTPNKGSSDGYEAKIKYFYTDCIDDYSHSLAGGKPFVDKVLKEAGGWNILPQETGYKNTFQIKDMLKKVHVDFWTDALFRAFVGTDWIDTSKNTIQIGLGGMTLYWWEYLDTTAKQLPIINATKNFMRTVSKLVMKDSGSSMTDAEMNKKAEDFAEDVYQFEFHMANLTLHTLPSDKPHEHENRMAIKDLNAKSDQFNLGDILRSMFQQAGVTGDTTVVLLEADLLTKLNDLVKNYTDNVRVLNNYLTWRLMLGYVTDLGWQYVHANREFYVARTGNPTFLGIPKYCFNKIQSHFGDALGAIYIEQHLHTNDKATVDNVVKYLKQGLQDRLSAINWMEEPSKKVAAEKLRLVVDKVGYPDWMTDNDVLDEKYKSLTIQKGNYLTNLIEIGKFEMKKANDKFVKGLDKTAWRVNVWDVHAEYEMFWNELLVSAGMLQWPIYAKNFPKYYNFGSIGVPLAHELVHAVDEIGGYYFPNGSYHDWWTKNTTTMYNKRRACFESLTIQAGPYKVDPDSPLIYVPIEGTYVARELTAEIAALRMALYAYKDWVADNSAEKLAPGLGLTNEQLLFLSYAQTQCYVRRDEFAISKAERKILPEDQRLNQALAHTPEFAAAFQCKPGSKMVAEKPCEVF
ncbi:endothelin-converting enzyme homolog [Watersipora subatra]|uniref:endothelin-converting enzyme homolog n=1 Tax=Watersipora subatra TaxID=2589382 RepID=UPI00355AF3D6